MIDQLKGPFPFVVGIADDVNAALQNLLLQKADGNNGKASVVNHRIFDGQGTAGFPGNVDFQVMAVQIMFKEGPGTASGLAQCKIFSFQLPGGNLIPQSERMISAADQHQKVFHDGYGEQNRAI